MAQQQPYTNYVNLKAYLGIPDSDTSQDKFLQIIIPQAMGFIDRYTGRSFGWGTGSGDSPYVDYSGTNSILISSASVTGTGPYTLTVVFVAPGPWQVGNTVILSGFTPSGYNGTYQVLSVSADNLTFTMSIGSNPGAVTVLGSMISDTSTYRAIIQESYDSLLGHTFYLRNSDIRSVDALWLGLRNINQPILLDKTQYVWRDDGRLILGGAYFNTYDSSVYSGDNDSNFWGPVASGYQTVTISYHYGYDGVPPEIELACLDICQTMNMMKRAKGLYMERVGDYQIYYQSSQYMLLDQLQKQPDILNILNVFRRRKVGHI